MATYNQTWLFIGYGFELDNNQTTPLPGNHFTENSAIGLYTNSGQLAVNIDPSAFELIDVVAPDNDGNGLIDDDYGFFNNEFVEYTVPQADQTAPGVATADSINSTDIYNVTVTQGDGTTVTGNVYLVQTNNTGGQFFGQNTYTFLVGDLLDGLNIADVTLNYEVNRNLQGLPVNQSVDNATVVCFANGTGIATPDGPKPIEAIRAGDVVLTKRGPKPVKFIASRRVSPAEMAANPKLLPVRITAGALGAGLPSQDLVLSRQHRMLVSSRIVERMLGVKEALISAIKLTALPGIFVEEDREEVTYYHMMLDEHEVVFAEDAPSESLLPGPEALNSLSEAALTELRTLFPDMVAEHYTAAPAAAIPPGKRQKQLVARHQKNNKPVLETAAA